MSIVWRNIIIVLIIILAAFLSQQIWTANSENKIFNSKSMTGGTGEKAKSYWSYAEDWFTENVYNKAALEAEKRKEIATQEIASQKDAISKTVYQKVEDYLAGIKNAVLNQKETTQASSLPESVQKCIQTCQSQ